MTSLETFLADGCGDHRSYPDARGEALSGEVGHGSPKAQEHLEHYGFGREVGDADAGRGIHHRTQAVVERSEGGAVPFGG
jgi:hypothetical protein